VVEGRSGVPHRPGPPTCWRTTPFALGVGERAAVGEGEHPCTGQRVDGVGFTLVLRFSDGLTLYPAIRTMRPARCSYSRLSRPQASSAWAVGATVTVSAAATAVPAAEIARVRKLLSILAVPFPWPVLGLLSKIGPTGQL
jgi:hypothetical protein